MGVCGDIMSVHTCLSTRRVPIGTILFSAFVVVLSVVWLALTYCLATEEEVEREGWPISYRERHLCVALLLMQLFAGIFWLLIVKLGYIAPLTCGVLSVLVYALSTLEREIFLKPSKILEQGGPTSKVELIVPAIALVNAVICLILLAFKRVENCRRCFKPISPVVLRTLVVLFWFGFLTIPLHFSSSHQKRFVNAVPAGVTQIGIFLAVFSAASLLHYALEYLRFSAHWTGAFLIAFMWYLAREFRDMEKLSYYDADGFNFPMYGLTVCYLMVETLHAILVRKEKMEIPLPREDTIKKVSLLKDAESTAEEYFGGVRTQRGMMRQSFALE